MQVQVIPGLGSTYMKGLLIHLTNPKAILFFGSLYALVISPQASVADLSRVVLALACVSMSVFFGYAVLFSMASVRRLYLKLRRVFESVMALCFGVAGINVLSRTQ